MTSLKEKLFSSLSAMFAVLFFVAWSGSLPLAIIFGNKWDVVISLVVPTWGFWVMVGELVG